jgi:prevent-host-death family protein
MKTVGIAELKANLSRHLDSVRAGQDVVVTDHGVAIARMVALEPAERGSARRQRLIRAGLLIPARRRLSRALTTPPKGPRVGGAVLAALIDERAQGR